jgi:hypothetical protein
VNPTELSPIDEPHFTTRQLARSHNLHQSTIRKLFRGEADVIRLGHGRLRIPQSVVRRVFGRLSIGGDKSTAA